jgi:enoyl-CoA hydratase/carnithine racemase
MGMTIGQHPGRPEGRGEVGASAVELVEGVRCLRLRLHEHCGGARLRAEGVDALAQALAADVDARIVVIEGAPGAFCEGLDLDVIAAEPGSSTRGSLARADAGVGQLAALLDALQASPRVVIAVVDGPALGGGLGLAAAADLVLASPAASFALPEALVGLLPAVVFPFVARRVGVAVARRLALGGERLSAAEALRLGLVDACSDDLSRELGRHVRRLGRTDARAIGAIKALTAEHFGADGAYRAAAVARFVELLGSDETRRRVRRLAEGLAPWDEAVG